MLVAMSCAQIIEGGALVNVITSKSITFIRVYWTTDGLNEAFYVCKGSCRPCYSFLRNLFCICIHIHNRVLRNQQ